MDTSLASLYTKYQLLELEEYMVHAFETALLYKEKGNDAKVLVKCIPCLITRIDDPLSVLSNRDTHFQSLFK